MRFWLLRAEISLFIPSYCSCMSAQLCLPFSKYGKYVAPEDLGKTFKTGKTALPNLWDKDNRRHLLNHLWEGERVSGRSLSKKKKNRKVTNFAQYYPPFLIISDSVLFLTSFICAEGCYIMPNNIGILFCSWSKGHLQNKKAVLALPPWITITTWVYLGPTK